MFTRPPPTHTHTTQATIVYTHTTTVWVNLPQKCTGKNISGRHVYHPPPTTQARIILKGEGEVNCLNLLITALRQDNLYTEMTLEFENGQNYNFGGREEDISKQRWVERHLSNPYLVPTCLT